MKLNLSQMSTESLKELQTDIHMELLSRNSTNNHKVCKKADCPCFFSYKGKMNGEPQFIPNKLVVWNLNVTTFEETRDVLLEAMQPRQGKVFVNDRQNYAIITLSNHAIAAAVQDHLNNQLGYNVNFFCSNMKELRGDDEE